MSLATGYSSVPVGIASAASLTEAVANVNIIYHKELEDYMSKFSVMKQLYNVQYEGPNAGTDFTVAESWTGSGVAHEIGEDDDYYAGATAPGTYRNVTVRQRTYSIALTWFLTYHNKYPQQESKLIRDAAKAIFERMEFDMSAPFTYLTSTSYTNIDGRSVTVSTGDGVAPASASHTLTNNAATCRNRIANDPQLTRGAVELGANLGKQGFLDNNGTPVMRIFDTIVVCNDETTLNAAKEIVKSKAPTDAPNGEVFNVYQGVFRVLQAFYIDRTFTVGGTAFTFDSTKSKQWMLFDTSNSGLYLVVTQWPTVLPPEIGQYNRNKTWLASACYEPTFLDWRCFVASVVTTS